jgi:hypothetical protein
MREQGRTSVQLGNRRVEAEVEVVFPLLNQFRAFARVTARLSTGSTGKEQI